MSQELVLVVLGVVVAVILLRPLLRTGSVVPKAKQVPPATADLPSTEELSELELDHAMGRISDADYERFRAETTDKTGSDAVSAEMMYDTVLNGESDAVARAEQLVRQYREQPKPRCPKCGERPEPGARFCSNCGGLIGDRPKNKSFDADAAKKG